MINRTACLSPRKAAIIVGISFMIMFPLAFFSDLVVFSNLIVPGDAATM